LENIANALDKDLKKNISGKNGLLENKIQWFYSTRSKTLPYFISDKGLI
jgi:hypothetical protein